MAPFHPIRASSTVRTLIVASSTLAIVGVCFGIYQLSQPQPEPVDRPAPPSRLPSIDDLTVKMEDPAGAPAVKIGGGRVGPGEKVRFSIYGERGDRARAEISMQSWTPVKGVPNKFDVVGPEVRLLTASGNAIKAVAKRGVLETRGKIGGDLDVRRGSLNGDVVIEIDRLSEDDRAKLPENVRHKIDPSQLIRIECDEILFDREYAKVTINGPFVLSARDARVQTADVEVRFNESAGRIDSCRIGAGGRIELSRLPDSDAFRVPGFDQDSTRTTNLSDWLSDTVQSVLAARQELVAQKQVQPSGEDVPVFGGESTQADSTTVKPAQRYRALFSGAIVVRQLMDGIQQSELLADDLEVLRDFSRQDRNRLGANPAASPDADSNTAVKSKQSPSESVVIAWKDRLMIQAVVVQEGGGQEEGAEGGAAEVDRISATGSPVTITSGQGLARCGELDFTPGNAEVVLTGTPEKAARIKMFGRGLVIGREIRFRQVLDKVFLNVAGPGRLLRDAIPEQGESASEEASDSMPAAIEFAERMVVEGSVITDTLLHLSGEVSQRKIRVIDHAVFTGRSTLRDSNTELSADRLEVSFSTQRSSSGTIQAYDRLEGRGRVIMTQGDDRMTCDEIDVVLDTDAGKPVPRRVVARGQVNAQQGTRSIRCEEELIVDFAVIERALGPFDPVSAYHKAAEAGREIHAIDWREVRLAHEAKRKTHIVATHLNARRGVEILDPSQQLDVSADRVDCDVKSGRTISTAEIVGLEDQAASVRLGELTVIGQKIQLDAEHQNADVPGEGMMTFLSRKDLDGAMLDEPMPITIAWGQSMRYRSDSSEAEFFGGVHAASKSGSTFDSDHLMVEFDEVAVANAGRPPRPNWWIFSYLTDHLSGDDGRGGTGIDRMGFNKEPAYLIATGHAKVITKELDETGTLLKSRAMITGPRLSVNLREGVSKMLIEEAGSLLLEDFRPADANPKPVPQSDKAFFELGARAGPSKTLIHWDNMMWCDFATRVARFEGDVDLKHFSGRELVKRFGGDTEQESLEGAPGRATFLTCDKLTATFAGESGLRSQDGESRIGGLSGTALSSFQSEGHVKLVDETEGLIVQGAHLGYDRIRELLTVYGNERSPASFIQQRPGRLPRKAFARRFLYNTATRSLSASEVHYEGRN